MLTIGPGYHETSRLRDGTDIVYRLICPEDKVLMIEGLARLSPESRYLRFLQPRDRLTTRELAYLTEVDQWDHVAIGVGTIGDDGAERGLGVARFIRLAEDPSIAEAAVTVADDVQGQGLGRALFKRLVVAAKERDVATFRLFVLADNDAMLGLMESLFASVTTRREDNVVIVDCELPEVALDGTNEAPSGLAYRLLSMAGQGVLTIVRRARAWPVPDPLLSDVNTEDAELDDLT